MSSAFCNPRNAMRRLLPTVVPLIALSLPPHAQARAKAGSRGATQQARDPARDVPQVMARAKQFFANLIAANPAALVDESAFPFYLENRKITQSGELLQEWTRNLSRKRTDLLVLYGIEVLTPAEMEKKYGKPPKHLASLPWRGADTYLAVGNLSGHAAVTIFRRVDGAWRVIAFHD
jgi:hypothetical protein